MRVNAFIEWRWELTTPFLKMARSLSPWTSSESSKPGNIVSILSHYYVCIWAQMLILVRYWISVGAQPTETVAKLFGKVPSMHLILFQILNRLVSCPLFRPANRPKYEMLRKKEREGPILPRKNRFWLSKLPLFIFPRMLIIYADCPKQSALVKVL